MNKPIRYGVEESVGHKYWISYLVRELAKDHKTACIQFRDWHNNLYFEHFSVVQHLDTELLEVDQIHYFDLTTSDGQARLISVLFLSSCYAWSLDLLIDGIACLLWRDEVLFSLPEVDLVYELITDLAKVHNLMIYD